MTHPPSVLPLYHRKNAHSVYLSLCWNYSLISLTKMSSLQQGLSLTYLYIVRHGTWYISILRKCLLSEIIIDIMSVYGILEKK